MLEKPFDILTCSWPRGVTVAERRWLSEPEWDAPLMPSAPQPRWCDYNGQRCWVVYWREVFSRDLVPWHGCLTGEMRGFHVVFRVRVNGSGRLSFWDDDGSFIRRNGALIHADREAHQLMRHEIEVSAGDQLEIAQWQLNNDWMWGAQLIPTRDAAAEARLLLSRYLEKVEHRLREPNGPPLKTFIEGYAPARTVLCLYSMILNGYSPARVILYGEHQWSDESRRLFDALLPFAEVVPTVQLKERIEQLGGAWLAEPNRPWFVLKACAGLLCEPTEFCLMDDDVFILEPLDEALRAFESCNFVYMPDAEYGIYYRNLWGHLYQGAEPMLTGRTNTGLFLLRNAHDPRKLATELLDVNPHGHSACMWEQGYFACRFGNEKTCELPRERYFYPYCDGLPGGILHYDYARNPCGFVSLHFGSLINKPTDSVALVLAPEILSRHTS